MSHNERKIINIVLVQASLGYKPEHYALKTMDKYINLHRDSDIGN